jgi:putative heme transporter
MTASTGRSAEPDQPPPPPGGQAAAGQPDTGPDAALAASLIKRTRRVLWSWRRWAAGILGVILLAVAVRAEGPMVSKSIDSFGHLHWRPLVYAVLFETLSMVALGMLERRILIMGGLPLRPGRAIALAYASNALSASLPVVGSGAATTFTYRRLVSQGATPALAGWSLTLSGIASNAAFVLIISIGGIVSGNIAGVVAGAIGTVLTLVAVVVTVIAMRRPPARERVTRAVIWTLGRVQRLIRRPKGDPAGIVAAAMAGLGAFGPNRRDITNAALSAIRNWTFDLLCLAFSIKAAGAHVPWWGIVLAWGAGTGGSSLNLTPGGLGVVEAALTGALVALGVPASQALTAVLVYRAISFWLAIAIGWPVYWRLRREQPHLALAVTAAGAGGPLRGTDHGPDDQPPDPAQPSPQEPHLG